MAFPTISATNTSVNSTATTSHTVSLPASITANDLLIIFFATQEKPVVTTPAGWTFLKQYVDTGGETCQVSIYYKIASGSEGASVGVTTSASWKSAHASYRIAVNTYTSPPEGSTGATGATGNPDPDALTPSGGAKDYKWIAVGVSKDSLGLTAPTNYSASFLSSTTGGAVALGVGTRDLNAASEDPGAFSSGVGRWGAGTIAVLPAASVANSNMFLMF